MSLPNIITIARMLAVPLIVWLIITNQMNAAFLIFVAAGISDGVDGFIAKRFDAATTLGAYLDPLADKLLLVSIYVSLGYLDILPALLVIIVVSRDVMIIGGLLLALFLERPMDIKPLFVSKANTAGQIILAGAALGLPGLGYPSSGLIIWGSIAVGILTIGSGGIYLRDWIRHMANGSGAQ
ncbi:MAG: CDP-alcohol phosphatidyltransferase family protein [Hyphomicrobiales bacterium]|nr:CDP-alcohol phosphatidyltransferase family protein [Hyphomicrobiales bacterium]